MNQPNFVYVTYIKSTQKKVWQALVEANITKQYWFDPMTDKSAHINVSNWEIGSEWKHERVDEGNTIDIVGKVLETLPPSRLVLSWARPNERDDETKHSRVTFEIEPYGTDMVKLTVSHDGLDPGMYLGVSKGWPMILSNLKTFLESGKALAN